ncbi:hypothetical protein BV898_00840 [Hypsibius exemplaris]|uniref:Uncharacterized protein n=1 Tax=Hypsibius exemplaris TaxID=2072580 RepID=A0A1W0XCG9_HYPEX|nr:hypothetical protein BV898_00840 [Hypsibius exemplaris]
MPSQDTFDIASRYGINGHLRACYRTATTPCNSHQRFRLLHSNRYHNNRRFRRCPSPAVLATGCQILRLQRDRYCHSGLHHGLQSHGLQSHGLQSHGLRSHGLQSHGLQSHGLQS